MSKTIDEHLKRLNPTGIKWVDMTDQQKLELREKWNAVVSVPENLNCSCPRTFCRMNRHCRNCVALNRYYDNFPDCVRHLVDKMQDEVPQKKKYNMHAKMQASGRPEGSVDPTEDPDIMRARLAKLDSPDVTRQRLANWDAVVKNPKNTACKCHHADCWYHSNCTKCIALHRYYDGFPYCERYIVDKVETIVDAYKTETGRV
jgi:hypothetical protein